MTDMTRPPNSGSHGAAEPKQAAADAKDAALDAKNAAADVAQHGKQAAQDVAQTGKQAAQDVVEQTKTQASDLLGKSRDQLTEQAGVQQSAIVDALRSVGDQLASMTERTDQSGVAVDLAAQGRDKARQAADWLGERTPDQVLDDLRAYGRERPGAFLLGSALAGIVAGRLTRGVVATHTDSAGSSQTGSTTRTTTGTTTGTGTTPPAVSRPTPTPVVTGTGPRHAPAAEHRFDGRSAL